MDKVTRRTVTAGTLGSLVALALGGKGVVAQSVAQKPTLFDAGKVGNVALANRVVMAPLTRGRAGQQRTANALMAEYYAQRAEAGLIIAEATAVSAQGYGWVGSPGIYTSGQAEGWKLVTDAVHQRGGRIFVQLWHMGRVSHPEFLDGQTPVGPSAIRPAGESYTPSGRKPYVTPREMTREEIATTVRDFAASVAYAKAAGFDGVEIHGANGYLLDQFLRDGSNRRTDNYGGSVANRMRFLLEVVEASARTWSADRIGVRLSPVNTFNDMSDSQPAATFTQVARVLNGLNLAYLHVYEPVEGKAEARVATRVRKVFNGPLILNGGYDYATGTAALAAREADMIAYGRPFLANPDLVTRFRKGAPLNKPDVSTFYTDGAKGYTDYPRFL